MAPATMFPTKTLTPNPSSRSLHGQTLLITGANRGIGLTLLEQALDRGAEVPAVAASRPR